MPKVPTYDNPQETLRGVPNVRQDSIASPEMFGGAAKQSIETGKALATAGTGVAAVGFKMREREDADSVFRAETALKDEYIQFEQEVRKTRTGRFAKDLTKDVDKWFGERLEHHNKNLTSDQQRRLFEQRAVRLRQAAAGAASTWEAQETNKSLVEGATASIGSSIGIAAANANPASVENARAVIDQNVRFLATSQGWTPEKIEAEKMRHTTALHTQVIQSMVRSDPVAAKAYFDANKGEIDGARHAEIGEFAEKVSANAIGEKTAAGVWETMGPKSDRTPVELDKMEDALRKELKGNEPALDSAIKRLRERTQAFKDARRERDEGLEATVNKAIMGGASRAAIARMPEFNQLSPEKARQIDGFLENRDYTRVARAAAEAQRADAEESRKQRRLTRDGIEAAYRLSDPQVLASMSRDQVINLLPILGAEHVGNLLGRYDSITKSGDKLTEATIDKQLFDTVALEVGLRPNEPKKSEEEKDQLVRLQNHIEAVIGQEQRSKGKALSREEKANIMRRELDKEVTVERRFWFDSTVRAPLLAPDELRRSVAKVDGKDFRLSTIPQKDYDGIVAAARRANVNVTPELVAEKWTAIQELRRKQGTR